MRRNTILAILFALWLAAAWSASAQQTVESVAVPSHYSAFREAQIEEVRSRSAAELYATRNIFYIGAEETEWAQVDSLVTAYFTAMARYGYQRNRLDELSRELRRYNVVIDTCNPIGYYSLWQKRVYLDKRLFQPGANVVFTRSVLYHEKIHENQIRLLDPRALSVDQKQRYWDKLQEIGAHYNQIRYVLTTGDQEALNLVLANSGREKMFSNMLEYYPGDDPVIQAVQAFMSRNDGILVAEDRLSNPEGLPSGRAGLSGGAQADEENGSR